jgi:hypothetical protein
LVLLASTSARATCPDGTPWVRVDSSHPDVTRLLRAELATQHIALCEQPDANAPAPIATVSLDVAEDTAAVRVEIHDSVTEKLVSRDVSLAGVPLDTRALTVALAADELLRASWAELTLATAPPPPKPPPVEVLATVHDQGRPETPHPPRAAVGVAAAIDAFVNASTLLGADVVVSVWIVARVRVEARFGVRGGLTQSGPDGDVASSALGGMLGAAVTLTPPARALGLDVAARVGFIRASFVPTPNVGATGTPSSDVAVVGDATVEGWLKLAPALRLVAVAGPIVALRPVRITDGGTTIGGIDGAGVTTSLGIAGTF